MPGRPRSIPTREFRVLQANVQRSWPKHKCALESAFQAQADVILIQEPAVFARHRRTQAHDAYRTFIPQDTWPARPRVITYVRKDNGLVVSQPSSGLSGDLLEITISSTSFPNLHIWNVYNAPTGCEGAGAALELLMQQHIRPNSLVAGDFNLRHSAWDHTVQQDGPKGTQLADWAAAQNLRLLNPPEIPTHRAGGVLDLAFSNNPTASARIAGDLHTSSDHETLWIQITGETVPPPQPGRLRLGPGVWQVDLFTALLRHARQPVSADADIEAQDIIETLSTALKGSAPRTLARSRSARWWTPECQAAVLAFRRARRAGPADTEKHILQSVVRQASRAYWRTRIEQADSLPYVYQVTNWHKKEPSYQSPPLQGINGPVITTEDKTSLLYRTLLCRQEAEDVPYDVPCVPVRTLPWGLIHPDEAYSATCQTTSTTPGLDEITASALKAAWPIMGSRITALFQRCLDTGVHPAAFKTARTVIVPKPGKRDRSLPKSYRPIALLSCLGKALERLVARRVAFLALEHKILAPDQCGAVPRHSATDLTTVLYSDVMDAWAQGRVAGIVTVDVQGAFDSVLGGRLALRLRQQGWPDQLVRWVQSFLTGRTTQITLDGQTSQAFPISCGLPQGSPVSPILFLLYIQPAISLSSARFGYADDGCLLATGTTLAACQSALQEALDQTLQWGRENGVTFEASKTELQYFTPGRRREEELPVTAGALTIQPNEVTRWLGIHFDRHLRFQEHVCRAAVRARAVTDHVKRLVGVSYGVTPDLLRQAVQGTALTTLFYGAETWYNQRTRIKNLEVAQRALLRAARAVLPVYCTTPNAAVLRETGWAPATAWLERCHDRLAARAAVADPSHPVRARWNRPAIRWIRQRQGIQASSPLRFPPWNPLDRDKARQEVAAVGRHAALAEREDFTAWVEARPIMDLTVYSDGSLRGGLAGAGFGVFRGPTTEVASGSLGLGNLAVVYDAEVIAATAGLQAALSSPLAAFATDVTVCLDNEEAAIRLHSGRPTVTSAPDFADFARLREAWTTRPLAGLGRPGKVSVRWIPSHIGIPGNERADALANAACSLPPCRTTASRAAAAILAETRYEAALQSYWDRCAPTRYRTLQITAQAKIPGELRIPRAILGHLLAARSAHGDFSDYHERFNHDDALLTCSCGALKHPEHFLICPLGQARARLGTPPTPSRAQWVLGTGKGAVRFQQWCIATSFFTTICFKRQLSVA